MTRQLVADKKEKSLAEVVIIIVLIALLMTAFIYYFFKQERQLTQVGYDTLASAFSTRINGLHAQWFMDKQPRYIMVASGEHLQKIYVNKNGWVDSEQHQLACEHIWQQVNDAPLMFMKMPIAVIEVQKQGKLSNKSLGRVCQFFLPTGDFFEYNSSTGAVSRAQQPNR